MKKNHGLILKILRFYEEKGDGNPVLSFPEIQGFTEKEVAYHIDLCVGDGLLNPRWREGRSFHYEPDSKRP